MVVPEKEMVLVFTSDLPNSFSVPRNLVDDFILPAAESGTPLAANPDSVANLQTLIQEAAQPEATPQPMPPLPAIAEHVLGETYILEENNVLGWDSVSLVRQDGAEAFLRVRWGETESSDETEFKLGLDGVQRLGPGRTFGMPAAGRGNWEGENVFIAEVDESGNLVNFSLEMKFKDDEVTATLTGNFPGTYVIQGKRARSP